MLNTTVSKQDNYSFLFTYEGSVGIVIAAVEARVLLESLLRQDFAHLKDEVAIRDGAVGLAQNGLDPVAESAVGICRVPRRISVG